MYRDCELFKNFCDNKAICNTHTHKYSLEHNTGKDLGNFRDRSDYIRETSLRLNELSPVQLSTTHVTSV